METENKKQETYYGWMVALGILLHLLWIDLPISLHYQEAYYNEVNDNIKLVLKCDSLRRVIKTKK